MRDLLFAADDARLEALMLRDVFSLKPETPLNEAMKLVLDRHYPVYPVCDENGVLIGLVRGQAMFEEQAIRDHRAGRHHGRRGKGGAARHALSARASSSATRGCS